MVAEQATPSESVLQLPITGRKGKRRVLVGWTTVLDDDFSHSVLLSMWWSFSAGYAHNRKGPRGRQAKTYLHRLVYEHYFGPVLAGLVIDHRDRNKLNNLPDNLRAVTQSINVANASPWRHNTSGFRGVNWYAPLRKWAAGIKVRQKKIHLGYFLTAREAADAVNLAFCEYFPEVPPPNPSSVDAISES